VTSFSEKKATSCGVKIGHYKMALFALDCPPLNISHLTEEGSGNYPKTILNGWPDILLSAHKHKGGIRNQSLISFTHGLSHDEMISVTFGWLRA